MVERALRNTETGTLVSLRVSPGARKTSLEGLYGGNALKMKVSAPPVGGKANAEVTKFLARQLGVAASEVTVARGATSRDKAVLVRSIGYDTVRRNLGAIAGRP